MRTPLVRAERRGVFLTMGIGLLFGLVLAGCGLTGSGPTITNQPPAATVPSTATTSSRGVTPSTGNASSTVTASSGAASTPTPGGQHASVKVIGSLATGYAFVPATITIKVGVTVMWINATSAPHTTTSDFGSTVIWTSRTINPEGAFRFTFTRAGVFHYHCDIHPNMHGTIIVTA